jgi:hypothetical protein
MASCECAEFELERIASRFTRSDSDDRTAAPGNGTAQNSISADTYPDHLAQMVGCSSLVTSSHSNRNCLQPNCRTTARLEGVVIGLTDSK